MDDRGPRDPHRRRRDDPGLDELIDDGYLEFSSEIDRRLSRLTLDDVATIVYTSGTSSGPKGCVLTHRNLAWTVRQTRAHLHAVIGQGGSLLQWLPLAHILARLMQFVCLDAGLRVGFARTTEPARDIREFRPTFLLAVPPMLEKVFEAARDRASGARRPLFDRAVSIGHEWATADRPGTSLRVRRGTDTRRQRVRGLLRRCGCRRPLRLRRRLVPDW